MKLDILLRILFEQNKSDPLQDRNKDRFCPIKGIPRNTEELNIFKPEIFVIIIYTIILSTLEVFSVEHWIAVAGGQNLLQNLRKEGTSWGLAVPSSG